VFVKYMLWYRVGRTRKPRLIVDDRSSCCRGARPNVARYGDDLVWFETNADHDPSPDVGAAPPATTAPELDSDPEILVSHVVRAVHPESITQVCCPILAP